MKVAIITPTTGSPDLRECIKSVRQQTYKNIEHVVLVDGQNRWEQADKVLLEANFPAPINEHVGILPYATGANGWYGHRVYAASPFIVNADAIAYLDQDNWIEPTHIESLVSTLKDNDWAYSLRKIYDNDGNFICEDNCESLGKWSTWFNTDVYHVDTSCFIVRLPVALQISFAWYGKWGQDRVFFHTLKEHFTKFDCTNQHTLCYKLGGNDGSVKKEFFIEGNEKMLQSYNGVLPWKK